MAPVAELGLVTIGRKSKQEQTVRTQRLSRVGVFTNTAFPHKSSRLRIAVQAMPTRATPAQDCPFRSGTSMDVGFS
jgi:predicted glycosyltransferase